MKSLIFGSLSLLLISTAIAPAYGKQQAAVNSPVLDSTSSFAVSIKPFDLVGLAYQGQLKNQGIPGYSGLIQNYKTRQLTAKDIVRSAVLAKKLPSEVLNDQGYINAVKNILDGFARDNMVN
ncbi:hypothetical protein LC607_08440 [Nostoc sp. CHAB 5824]|nr:hypothetical protein [Nostoc sp. CHAB 5824]